MSRREISATTRRQLLRLAAAGVAATSTSGWIEALADDASKDPNRKKSVILLWMNGGPSQMDTFDLKPGHANGGPFKAIDSSVPGIKISEHLPKVAASMKDLAIIRSMSTKEGDHGRATYYLRTGYLPQGGVQYPPLGSFLSKELERDDSDMPNFVSVSPFRVLSPASYTPGFLGTRYAPLIVGDKGYNFGITSQSSDNEISMKVDDLDLPAGVDVPRHDARLGLLDGVEGEFNATHPGTSPSSHRAIYERAVRMMRSTGVKAFDLDEEPDELRDAYGRNQFGQGCLLARRLIERGVPFVEVTLGTFTGNNDLGWDTHQQNFENVKKLSGKLDGAWATLIQDLKLKGLFDSTLIVWMGEFGRTPKINGQGGRDHFPGAWTTVLSGGGIKGGQVIGSTSSDGQKVVDRPVSVPDFMSTVCRAIGLDPMKQNISNVGRPIRLADPDGKPIKEILA